MAQNENSMMCHPHADQQAMFWLNNILNKTHIYDTRLLHQPPASIVLHLSVLLNYSYWCVHGVYDKTMRSLGLRANDNAKDFQPFLSFQVFVKTKSLIAMHFILCGNINPCPAKITPRGTWKTNCGWEGSHRSRNVVWILIDHSRRLLSIKV